MAAPARRVASLRTDPEGRITVTFEGAKGPVITLRSLARTDLRLLAGEMRVGGEKTATNEELRERIIRRLQDTGGVWINPHTRQEEERDKGEEIPPWEREYKEEWRKHTPGEYPKSLWCPNGHGEHVFSTPETEWWQGGMCKIPGCRAKLTDVRPAASDDAPIPEEAAPKKEERRESEFADLPAMPEVSHFQLPAAVSALQAGKHVYLAGMPGTGKSELARQAAEVLGMPYHFMSCDSSMTRSVLMGLLDANGTYHSTPLRQAIEHGGVFVLDEMDNGNPSLLAALNSAMANGKAAFPDGEVDVHPDFRVIATANTWGTGPTADFVGRLRVDPATLDRFVRVYVGVDANLEERLTEASANGDLELAARVLKLVRGIRARVENEGLRIIVSPRASMTVAALAVRGWSLRDAVMTTAVGTLEAERANTLIEGLI